MFDTLEGFVAHRELLIVVNNCEHLIHACTVLVEHLLRAGSGVRVLATSREVLGLPGERVWRVPSLSLADQGASPDVVMSSESARLFLERARAVRADLVVSDEDVADLAEIVSRLDGIPLALELAAARVGMLSLAQIATRLDGRFGLLSRGPRTALPRQQTLAGAIDWSYGLLGDLERTLFRRLSIFPGGFSLEAVEAVTTGPGLDPGDILDLLANLAAKSLVVVSGQGSIQRYRLLETIRAYAADKLGGTGEQADLRDRHLAWFLDSQPSWPSPNSPGPVAAVSCRPWRPIKRTSGARWITASRRARSRPWAAARRRAGPVLDIAWELEGGMRLF